MRCNLGVTGLLRSVEDLAAGINATAEFLGVTLHLNGFGVQI